MQVIDGKKIAQDILLRLKLQTAPKKTLVAILVVDSASSPQGDGLASMSFIRQKEKTAKELGVNFKVYTFSKDIAEEDLIKEVENISKMDSVGGVIVQLPLPEGINRQNVLNVIPVEKDVDVLSEKTQGAFRAGTNPVLPPAVATLEEILKTKDYQLTTSRVAVVGLGFLVGKPISEWLRGNTVKSPGDRGARTKELFLLDIGSDFSVLKEADLVITGTGQAGLIKPEMLKGGAGVIDFGYGVEKLTTDNLQLTTSQRPKIKGDFDTELLVVSRKSLVFYTPTPGGTGPILVAKLLENFYKLNNDRDLLKY